MHGKLLLLEHILARQRLRKRHALARCYKNGKEKGQGGINRETFVDVADVEYIFDALLKKRGFSADQPS